MSERLGNEAVVERAIQRLGERSVEGEVFFRESTTTSVEVKDGEIENVLAHGERGIGIRVVDGLRVGFAFTSDLSTTGIDECAVAAESMSAVTEPDPDIRISSDEAAELDLGIFEGVGDRTIEQRADSAFAAERAARMVDPRVTGFRKTSYHDGEATTILATTRGTRGSYAESWAALSTSVIASEGDDRQIGYHGHASRRSAEIDAEGIGRHAASVAVGKLAARTNLLDLLASISGVGSDLRFGGGGIGSPTLVISELSIGGT